MAIVVGDRVPNVTMHCLKDNDIAELTTQDLFAGKRVVLFALPGAFTPTCSAAHLPGYVVHADEIKAKGIDTIACLSVNDAFVMDAWARSQNVEDRILMVGDGNCEFTKAVGLGVEITARGYGFRSQRYAMIVDDGVVTHLNVEEPAKFEVSDAETMLGLL